MENLVVLNDFIWNYIMVALMVGSALWFTFRLRFVQFSMFPEMLRLMGKSSPAGTVSKRSVSSFEALMLSLASRVGVGNLAGVTLAITVGGPGSIFWMWVMALLNAATAFVEATLAQLYKVRSKGLFIGGPAYYIDRGLKSRWMAVAVVFLTVVTFSYTFCSVQSNTIAISVDKAFGIDRYISALLIGALMFAVVFGGVRRIVKITGVLVPVMALAYIFVAIYVIVSNIDRIPEVLSFVMDNAFGIRQIAGGSVGAAFMQGAKRGLFSNEAGMGAAPNAAATADVPHPVNQGLLQALGVFIDTILICSCTAFIILLSVADAPSGLTGIEMTQFALSSSTGLWAYQFIAVIVFFFGFSTCISNTYYGESNIKFLSDNRFIISGFRIVAVLLVMAGAVIPLEIIWSLADFFLIFIVFINLISLMGLGKYVFMLLDNYKTQRRNGVKKPVFNKKHIPELDRPEVECW